MVYSMVVLEVRNGDNIITVYSMIVVKVRNGDLLFIYDCFLS